MRNTKTKETNQADEELATRPADTGVTDHEQFRELVPALLDCSQSVFYIVQDKKFQVVTKQLLREMGLSQRELLGANPLSIVHPDDRARVRENAIKMLKGERSEPYEFRTLDKYGNIHFVREAVTSITYRGKPATLGNWIELTEQKRAEEELRRSENSLSEAQRVARIGNWDWEIKPDKLHWSAEMYRIFGFDPRFAANYSTFLDSVHPDDREFVQQSVYAALFKNQPYNLEYRIVLPDSSERIIYASGQVSFDDETGQPVRMLGTVQDITERK